MRLRVGDRAKQNLGAALLGIFIAGGIELVRSGPPGLVTFIKDYQTLLAGYAAAAAAFFTVLQMQITDAKAERRHTQLFAAELRDDRLCLRHARFQLDREMSSITKLEALADDLGMYVGSYMLNRREEPTEVSDVALQNALATWKKMEEAYRSAFYTLDSERVREASKLFGPRLNEKYEQLRSRTRGQPSGWKRDLDPNGSDYTNNDFPILRRAEASAIKFSADKINKNVGLTSKDWKEVLEGVDRLIRKYPVVLDAE